MILVDAGPLVALVNADDQHHDQCVSAFRGLRESLATLWPPLTEAMYFLMKYPEGLAAIRRWLERSDVQLLPLGADDLERIGQLMEHYADLPMDLADAAFIRVAERDGIRTIFTLNRRDFSVYRLHGRVRPRLIP